MSVNISDIYRKKFPVDPKDITCPSPEEAAIQMECLKQNLALAQERYERNLKPLGYEANNPLYAG